QYDGAYRDYWEMVMDAPKSLSAESFQFKNKSYSFQRYQKQFQNRTFDSYYLDIHSGWERKEIESILLTLRDKTVFVEDEGLKRIDLNNQPVLLDKLLKRHFSLFPVYAIKAPAKSLLITKGNTATPVIGDVAETPFEINLRAFMQSHQKLATVEFGSEPSAYIKTLREYRVLDFEKADLSEFDKMIREESFPVNQENEKNLLLKDAELIVQESDAQSTGKAPDHLFRLFAYSRVMKAIGETGVTEVQEEDSIMNTASEAHIVTPVSSLIVLETQADYDRFQIHDKPDHLKNAAINQTGAAPEPHEWVLIILCVLMLAYARFRTPIQSMLWVKRLVSRFGMLTGNTRSISWVWR
ncbi:MAG: XrtN system VIT domain-containing protein, partial [Pedobacter sp.]